MSNYSLKDIKNTNVRLFLQAAEKMSISWTMVDDDRYQIILEKDGKTHQVTAHSFGLNSPESICLTRNKFKTYQFFKKQQIPVLPKLTISSKKDYLKKYHLIPFPQVIKPAEGEKGRDVFLNLSDQKTAEKAISEVLKKYQQTIIEPYFAGHDIRLMTLGHQVVGLSRRHSPTITGDGKHSISQLIELENRRRTALNEKAGIRMLNRFLGLTRIKWYLDQQGLNLNSALPEGKTIKLHQLPNYSAGGWVETLSFNQIHPSFLRLVENISRLVNLEIMGMDILIKNLKQPAVKSNCAVIEVNSDPGIRLHDLPNKGKSQHTAEKILQYIFTK